MRLLNLKTLVQRAPAMRFPSRFQCKAVVAGGDKILNELRKHMSELKINALIVPSDDPHLSEYVAPCFERRAFISGFTGSAGTALITEQSALLWTDGRYFLQADNELSSNWTLMKSSHPGVPTMIEYIQTQFGSTDGATVAIDAQTHSAVEAQDIEAKLCSHNITVAYLSQNLIDRVWGEGRPHIPTAPVRKHHYKYAGVSSSVKLKNMAGTLQDLL